MKKTELILAMAEDNINSRRSHQEASAALQKMYLQEHEQRIEAERQQTIMRRETNDLFHQMDEAQRELALLRKKWESAVTLHPELPLEILIDRSVALSGPIVGVRFMTIEDAAKENEND